MKPKQLPCVFYMAGRAQDLGAINLHLFLEWGICDDCRENFLCLNIIPGKPGTTSKPEPGMKMARRRRKHSPKIRFCHGKLALRLKHLKALQHGHLILRADAGPDHVKGAGPRT